MRDDLGRVVCPREVAALEIHAQITVCGELEDCATLTTMLVAQAEVATLQAVRPEL